jgi:hypothetical protein
MVIKLRRMRWIENIAGKSQIRNIQIIIVEKPYGKRTVGRHRH